MFPFFEEKNSMKILLTNYIHVMFDQILQSFQFPLVLFEKVMNVVSIHVQELHTYSTLFVHSDYFTNLVDHEKLTIAIYNSTSVEFFSFSTVITKYLARIKKINIKNAQGRQARRFPCIYKTLPAGL